MKTKTRLYMNHEIEELVGNEYIVRFIEAARIGCYGRRYIQKKEGHSIKLTTITE